MIARGFLCLAILLTLFVSFKTFDASAVTSGSLAARPTSPSEEKTAQQVYKNIQVLNELPATELDGVMSFMSAALGVGCAHCHANTWDSDEKSTKLAARKMITMTRAINKENFSGNPAIPCYSCHRGQHNTQPNLPIDLATTPPTDATIAPTKTAGLPTPDEVIARYTRAIGDQTAIEALQLLRMVGTETVTGQSTDPRTNKIEILRAPPDKLLIATIEGSAILLQGFDGKKGWAKDASGERAITDKDLIAIKRDADFFRFLKIREGYPQIRVLGKSKIKARDVYMVGASARDESRETLYFDVESGLLVRRFVSFKTAFGSIPEVTDFDDYREIGGIKFPFTITWSRPPYRYVRKFSEIKTNPLIDPPRFSGR